MIPEMRHYPQLNIDTDIRILASRSEEGLESQLLVIQTPFGYRRMGEFFQPEEKGSYPGILYVHWYEPEAPTSNRSQFVEEAKQMARKGAVCLLIETLWSDVDFFLKRTQQDDMKNSIQEVVNIRRAIDLLSAQENVDKKRIAYVGHDFGGMYGVLAGDLDRRPSWYVIMAATSRFSDWYLYLPKLEGNVREEFIQKMSEIDPISHVAGLYPSSIFFQFGDTDPHVPLERAEKFFMEAKGPKEKQIYSCGHELNAEAEIDRINWLSRKLELEKR